MPRIVVAAEVTVNNRHTAMIPVLDPEQLVGLCVAALYFPSIFFKILFLFFIKYRASRNGTAPRATYPGLMSGWHSSHLYSHGLVL
jgi:hypothetical protein